jgi:hypothetical protein
MIELATIAQAVSVIAACWTIIAGIGAWKREFVGKRQIELAEQTLAKFYEIKDAILFIRNPFSSIDEGSTRAHEDHESVEDTKLLDRGYIVVERYSKKESNFSEFNLLKYRYMATFGSDKEQIFTQTFTTLNSIFNSARMLATYYWKRQGRVQMESDEFQQHLDEMRHHQSIFWDTQQDDKDPVRLQLKSIQEELELITKSCYREPSTLYTWLTKPIFGSA